jgi:FtsP/CotA-like multicopper oxidase with cupredoxin domain
MSDVTRRSFLAAAGATLALGPSALGRERAPVAGAPAAWPASFDPRATRPAFPPRELPKPGERIHEFDFDLRIGLHEIVPGVKMHAFTYNGSYPGPEIRVPEGDWVLVNFTNRTSELHTIHWHGIQVPCEMDGVPNGTQWPVGLGETFRYLFRAQPAGTHFYHCHNMTTLHVQAGMFGAIIVEPRDPKDDPVRRAFPYEREYTLLLSEVDTDYVQRQMNDMAKMSDRMAAMSRSAKLMREMNGRMMGWFKNKQAFLDAIRDGYVPPYLASRTGYVPPPNFNFFMINGKSYPMTDELLIRTGENIRVRLIGAGAMPHSMHLHGHDFWQVCQDGSPLSAPVRMNTIPVHPGTTSDIIIQGTNPGCWHFHDHSDLSTTNNGQFPGGMMTMLMYEDLDKAGVKLPDILQVSS